MSVLSTASITIASQTLGMTMKLGIPSGEQVIVDSDSSVIGRGRNCDVALPEQTELHKRHAQIKKVANQWIVESLGDWMIQVGDGVAGRKCRLKEGDPIRLTPSGVTVVFEPTGVGRADQPSEPGPDLTTEKPKDAGSTEPRALPALQFANEHFLDHFIRSMRRNQSVDDLQQLSYVLIRVGYYSLFAGMAGVLAFTSIEAIRADSITLLIAGLSQVCLLLVLQYAAVKLASTMDLLIRSTPVRMSSTSFLDSITVACALGGLVGTASLCLMALRTASTGPFLAAICVLIMCLTLSWICLNPAFLNIGIGSRTSVGDEAIGVASFVIFLWVRSIPVQFAVGGVLGTVGIWLSIWDLIKGGVVAFPSTILGAGAISLLFASVAAPVAGYLLFLVLYLFVDLIRRNLHTDSSVSATDESGC